MCQYIASTCLPRSESEETRGSAGTWVSGRMKNFFVSTDFAVFFGNFFFSLHSSLVFLMTSLFSILNQHGQICVPEPSGDRPAKCLAIYHLSITVQCIFVVELMPFVFVSKTQYHITGGGARIIDSFCYAQNASHDFSPSSFKRSFN